MPPAELRERAEPLDHPRALGPATPRARRERHDRHLAGVDRRAAALRELRVERAARVDHVARLDVLDCRVRRQPIRREPDASREQVRADRLVLRAVEAVLVEELVERAGRAPGRGRRVVGARPARCFSRELRDRPAVVDREVVDDRLHRERNGRAHLGGERAHVAREPLLRLVARVGLEHEAHPAARRAAEHPEAQEAFPEARPRALDQRLGEAVRGPGHDRLDRALEVARRRRADPRHVTFAQAGEHVVQHAERLVPRRPFALAPQEVLLRHHLEDRPHVLGHPAVDEHEAPLQRGARRGGRVELVEDAVRREQAAAGHAELRVALARQLSLDELHARPQSARVLPASARAAEPLAEDRARGDEAPFALGELAFDGARLSRRAHAERDERGEQVRRDREPRALGDPAHPARQREPAAGAAEPREQPLEALPGALEARGARSRRRSPRS